MLRRLRARTEATPAPTAADPARDDELAVEAGAAALSVAPAAAVKPLKIDQKIAMLTDTLIELVPGITMPFSRQELTRIKKQFVSLQQSDSLTPGSIAAGVSMPELAGSPFAKLLLQKLVPTDASTQPIGTDPPTRVMGLLDHITFNKYLTALAILSVKQSLTVKRQVLFRIYDADRDGRVSVDDFVATLLTITSSLTRPELKETITSQFPLWVSHTGETTLTLGAFQALFSDADIHAALTVNFYERKLPSLRVPALKLCILEWRAMVKWNIATFARIRPPRRSHECAKFILEKLANGAQTAARISYPPPGEDDLGSSDRVSMKQRELLQFQYTDIFDPGVSQDDVFNTVCRDIVYSALDGYNGSILAYGQTGSGKTYTITGGEHYADRGIIPRVLSTIFEEFERRASTVRYACYISYLEIYNETVYDLLDRSHTDRPIEEWTKVLLMDDDDGEMHFRNLGVYEAVSEEEALNLLFLGNMNRVTSDTPMNQASSRSHSVFSVMLEARPLDSDVIVTSKLHLVDLAGSERVYKREGTQRMRTEGKHINLSLHHLEQVILSLRTSKTPHSSALAKTFHVPYRNSMLTSVLRGSLGGNCKSVFIATLNPESEFVDESISTCRFMQRCAEVSVEVAVNSEVDTEKRLVALEKTNGELEAVNSELKTRLVQLEEAVATSGAFVRNYQRDQTQWQRERVELLAQVAYWQTKQRVDEPLHWGVCEELVEKLLLTGDVPRRVVETIGDREESDEDEDEERREARQLFHECINEIRTRGLTCAVGCLSVLRESTVFASNTAADLQEMMETQTHTVALLEERLREQKLDAEALKTQVRQLSQARATIKAVDPADSLAVESRPPVPRGENGGLSKSLRSAASIHSHRSGGSGVASRAESEGSESDSELDSEATDARPYPHPHPNTNHQQPSTTTMSLVFNGGNSRAASAAPVTPFPGAGLGLASKQQNSNNATDEPQGKTSGNPTSPPIATVSPPVKSGSDMIRRRMDLLKNGSLFVKYGRFGKPHVRFVWCSVDLEFIHYRKVSAAIAKAAIPTRSVQRIVAGQQTRVFERARQPTREPYCFSIEYDDGATRTLDLEITDGDGVEQKKSKRSEWIEALQFLVKLKAAQQKKTPQPQATTPAAVPPAPTTVSS